MSRLADVQQTTERYLQSGHRISANRKCANQRCTSGNSSVTACNCWPQRYQLLATKTCISCQAAAFTSLLSLLSMLPFVLCPAVLVKESAGPPGEVLCADVHVWVLRRVVLVLVRMGQVPDSHANAHRDGCKDREMLCQVAMPFLTVSRPLCLQL